MNDMDFEKITDHALSSPVGAYVLETLTVGMYTDARDAIREYIQNSMDSLNEAVNQNLIGEDSKSVQIKLDEGNNQISIIDNGIGISPELAPEKLLTIGKSSKRLGQSAGFRGIGRLAGIAYCDLLKFKTTTKGSNQCAIVRFDCKKIRKNFNATEKLGTITIEEALRESCSTETDYSDANDHYFEVCLEGLRGDGKKFTNTKEMERYLSYTAPVNFDSQKFILSSKVRNRIENSPFNIPTIEINLIDQEGKITPVFKPYSGSYNTRIKKESRMEIRDLNFFDDGPQNMYWGWYGESDLEGTILDEKCSGLRFRVENILVGGSDIAERLFKEGRFNRYFIGEIYINPKFVTPNARRDDFEDTEDWKEIKDSINNSIILKLAKEVRIKSVERNNDMNKKVKKAKNVIESTKKTIDLGIASKSTKNNMIENINDQIQSINKKDETLTNDERNKVNEVIEELQKTLDDLNNTKIGAVNSPSTLDRKQKQILKLVFEVLEKYLDQNTYKIVKEEIEEKLKNPREGKRYGKE